MPTPPQFLKTRDAPDTGVTNIRNTASPHWRRWLGVQNRCLVPATSFSEYGTKPDPVTKRKALHWFALDESRPLFFPAGIWTPWTGMRGSMKTPRPGEHQLLTCLTCEPNAVVKPVHPKAMPGILTTEDEIEMWMTADWVQAQALQRPLADEALTVLPSTAPRRGTGAAALTGRTGAVKIATYNINGINGRLDTLLTWLSETSPDIVCLQELKAP